MPVVDGMLLQERAAALIRDKAILARRIQELGEEKDIALQSLRQSLEQALSLRASPASAAASPSSAAAAAADGGAGQAAAGGEERPEGGLQEGGAGSPLHVRVLGLSFLCPWLSAVWFVVSCAGAPCLHWCWRW